MEPKIRFKGFEGEWKTPSIGEVFELRNGYTPSKAVNEFWEGGTIPWFRMEDIRTNGGILKDAIQHITPLAVKGAGLFEKNSIILATTATIGVHAMLIADSLANQQFTNFRVRKSLSDSYIDNFLYYSFFNIDEWSKKNTNSGGLLSVNMPLLVKQPLYSPCKQEQQAIASYFTSLDSQISASTSRLASLKQMKAASLQAMFPQEGETVPKIRFKGFEGEWKKVMFSELYERSSIKNDLSFGTDKIISVANMYFIKNSRQVDDDYLRSYNIMRLGDIAFEGNKSKNFAHGRLVENTIGDGIVSHVFIVMKPISKNYDLNFWKYYINNENIMGNILVRSTKSSTMMTDLVVDDFLKESILVPSYEEQIEIGKILTSLDRQISLQSQRLEKLKQIKSACLDKMFV